MSARAPLGSHRLFEDHRRTVDSVVTLFTYAQALATDAGTIVEVGCGRGVFVDGDERGRPLHDLRAPGRRVIGIDIDPAGAANPVIEEFRPIAGQRWPLADGAADLVVCDWVLEHVTDPVAFIAELTRVLRPGGAFVARTVNRYSLLAMGARAVPNRLHPKLLARLQPGRQAQDVFPTAYRLNTLRDLDRRFSADFDWAVSFHCELAEYARRWPRLATVVATVEPRLPRRLQSMLVLSARKR